MEISVIQSNDDNEFLKLEDEEGKTNKWKYIQKCILPSKKQLNRCITHCLVFLLLSATLFGILNENVLPGSEMFALFALTFLSFVFGKVLGLTKVPSLIGMLIIGFLFRNLDVFPYYRHISKETTAALRGIALCYILLRAGLGLEGSSLRRLKLVVMRLTFLPCLTEAAGMAVFSHYILKLPWIFSFMLGFIISAVSPAIVLPPILYLEKKKYGIKKGIPTMIIAATSLDDILAISGFTVCFSIAFSQGNLVWIITKGPLEPLVGFAFGAVFGVIFWYFPSRNTSKGMLIYYNVLLISLGSMAAMFLSRKYHIPGAGPLACITLAFVAAVKWRKDPEQLKGVNSVLFVIWLIIEPFLFSLIGAEVTVKSLKETAGYATLAVFCSLVFRLMTTALITYGANLNIKEKIFICISWLPKATVQAAIGSQVFDYARSNNKGKEQMGYGVMILNVSVISILLTAPLGAILMKLLGPVLLTRDISSANTAKENETCEEIEETNETETVEKKPVSDYGSCSLLQSSRDNQREHRSF